MARHFFNANDTVNFGASVPNLTANWTVSTFLRRIAANQLQTIYSRWTDNATNRQLFIYFNETTNANTVQVDVPFVSAIMHSTATITDANWHHICVTRSANVWTLYLDGAQDTQTTVAATQETGGAITIGTSIGSNTSNSNPYLLQGDQAELCLWNAALTAGEVKALFFGRIAARMRPGSIVGYWPLWGLQSPEPDLSGSQNNGTLTGTAQANHAPVTLFTEPNFNFTASPLVSMSSSSLSSSSKSASPVASSPVSSSSVSSSLSSSRSSSISPQAINNLRMTQEAVRVLVTPTDDNLRLTQLAIRLCRQNVQASSSSISVSKSSSSSGPSSVGPSSVGPSSVGPSSVGPSSVGPSSVGPSSVGASSVGPSSVGASSVGPSSVGASSVGASSVGPSSVGPSSVGASSVRASSVGASSVGTSSVGASSVGPSSAKPSSTIQSSAGPSSTVISSVVPSSTVASSTVISSATISSALASSVAVSSLASPPAASSMAPTSSALAISSAQAAQSSAALASSQAAAQSSSALAALSSAVAASSLAAASSSSASLAAASSSGSPGTSPLFRIKLFTETGIFVDKVDVPWPLPPILFYQGFFYVYSEWVFSRYVRAFPLQVSADPGNPELSHVVFPEF